MHLPLDNPLQQQQAVHDPNQPALAFVQHQHIPPQQQFPFLEEADDINFG